MKKMLLSLSLALSTTMLMQAQTVVNGGFEDWGSTPLTVNTPIEGLDKYDLSNVAKPYPFANTWAIAQGNAEKEVNFQVARTAGRSGEHCLVYMSNHSTNDARFYNSTPLSLEAKNYKVKFWIRGKATLRNVILSKKATDPSGNEFGQTSSTSNIIVPLNHPSICKAYDLSDTWTEVAANFTITVAADYKIYFSILSSASINATEDPNNFFMVDDITIEEDADPTICTLSNLTLKGSRIDNFNASTEVYDILIAQTAVIPELSGTATDSRATVEYTQITNLSGTETERTATAVVTAADGTTKMSYRVVVTMTDDLLLEGLRGDAIPDGWASSAINGSYATWWLDTSAANNNGVYWGGSSLRPRAGDASTNVVTAGDLTLPELPHAEQLSFHIKSSTSLHPATLTTKWKLAAEAAEVWNELETISTFSTTYESKSYTLHQNAPIIIRFSFTKTDLNTFPFYLDDLKVSSYSAPSSISTTSPSAPVVYVDENRLTLSMEQADTYCIVALDGKTVAQGVAAHAVVQLPQGIYFVKVAGQVYKVAVP